MEVRVNGSSDLLIEEPVITASDVGEICSIGLDGMLGQVIPLPVPILTLEDYHPTVILGRIGLTFRCRNQRINHRGFSTD